MQWVGSSTLFPHPNGPRALWGRLGKPRPSWWDGAGPPPLWGRVRVCIIELPINKSPRRAAWSPVCGGAGGAFSWLWLDHALLVTSCPKYAPPPPRQLPHGEEGRAWGGTNVPQLQGQKAKPDL